MSFFLHTKKSIARILLALFAVFFCCAEVVCAKERVIRVGMVHNLPPFEFIKNEFVKDFGSVERLGGLEVELLAAISKRVGFTYDIRSTTLQNMFIGLQTGQLDMGVAAIAITTERKRLFDFSDSYCCSGLGIFVPRESVIESVDNLGNRRVGVLCETLAVPFVNKNAIDARIVLYRDLDFMIKELMEGAVDAVVVDVSVFSFVVGQPDLFALKRIGKIYEQHPVGIAFPKESKLLKQVNVALAELREAGEYAKIYRRWMREEVKSTRSFLQVLPGNREAGSF